MSDTGSSIVLDTHRPINMNYKSEDVYIICAYTVSYTFYIFLDIYIYTLKYMCVCLIDIYIYIYTYRYVRPSSDRTIGWLQALPFYLGKHPSPSHFER